MPRVHVEKVLGPARRRIIAGLRAFNAQTIGKAEHKALAITLRQGREIVGGLTGWTWMDWCFIELLWVDEKYRGKDYGTALMRKAESEVRKRGVTNMYVDTFSFQAPGFYKKLGFKQFAELKGFPKGHSRYWFEKAL